MSFYQENLSTWGMHADSALAVVTAERDVAVGQLATAQEVARHLEAALLEEQQAHDATTLELVELQATVRRLRRRLRDLAPDEPAGMLVGTSLHRESGEDHQQAFERRTRNWGAEPQVVRYFFSGLPSAWPRFGDAEVVVSFKAHPRDVIDGRVDGAVRTFFHTAPTDRKARWCWYHEREDNIENGEFTEAEYREGFHRLVDLSLSVGNPQLSPGQVLMGWTANPSSGRDTQKFTHNIPVEWIGWDTYPGPSESDTRYKYQLCAAATEDAGVGEWLLCETGLHDPNNQSPATVAAWIPVGCRVARDLEFAQWTYFDSTVGGDFRLTEPVEWAAIGAEIVR